MDKANEDVCGPAIAHLLQRAYRVYGDTRYERLYQGRLTIAYGGGDQDRTDDLLIANQTLSQLSYTPTVAKC